MYVHRQTIDEQMNKIKQDAGELCDPNYLPSKSEAEMHAAMQKAIETVRTQLQDLTRVYELLMKTCQQKRDLYIVCVKFHMNLRQVYIYTALHIHSHTCNLVFTPTVLYMYSRLGIQVSSN